MMARKDCWLKFYEFLLKNKYISRYRFNVLINNKSSYDITNGLGLYELEQELVNSNISIIRGALIKHLLNYELGTIIGLILEISGSLHVIGLIERDNVILVDSYGTLYPIEDYLAILPRSYRLLYALAYNDKIRL